MRYVIVILVAILLNMPVRGGDVIYAPDAPISCDIIPMGMRAVYEIGRYACQDGYYLPADGEICTICPIGGICSGGTFTLNPNEYQGLVLSNISGTVNNVCADNFPTNMYAVYQIKVYTCNPGYYLPADTDGCVICPANSYCAGGTYTFDENVPQGVTSCVSGLYAPTGMWESAQCGRILHIGDNVMYLRSVKQTIPSLNIDIDNDGAPDYFGNMTTADVVMNCDTERKLKISFGGQTYSVYDDTVDLP